MDVLLGQLFQGLNAVILALYQDRTGIAQKMCRLEILVINIRSVVEVSEMAEIQSESLRSWQQKLKDAAIQGQEVLRKLEGQLNISSSSTSGILTSFERFISQKVDVETLNNTIERLEQVSTNLKDFCETLKFELHLLEKMNVSSMGRSQPKYGIHDRNLLVEQMPVMSCDYATHSHRVSDKLEKWFVRKIKDEGRLVGDIKESFNELVAGPFEKAHLISLNRRHTLPRRIIEEVAVVEGLVARIQSVLTITQKEGDDGSWFGWRIAMLREAVKEGNCVVSALKSKNYHVRHLDQMSDEVSVVVSAVRQRLETVVSDLEDFRELAEVQKLGVDLTARSMCRTSAPLVTGLLQSLTRRMLN